MTFYQEPCSGIRNSCKSRQESGKRPWMPVPPEMTYQAGMAAPSGMTCQTETICQTAGTPPAGTTPAMMPTGTIPLPIEQTAPPSGQKTFNPGSFPIGMGYVPCQQWQQPYSLEEGFRRGTIFPALDLPFVMGRCV